MSDWLAPKYQHWIWQGFGETLMLSAAVAVAATLLGFGVSLARQSRYRAVRHTAGGYVLVFRNSPLIVQLLFLYFGIASILPDPVMTWLNTPHVLSIGAPFGAASNVLRWPSFEFVAGFVGLTLYSTTFIAEEFRAGLLGVAVGQYHAAAALGMSPLTAFRYVVLPQAVRIALPSLFGQYMNIVKNSSLTMAIGLAELSYSARQVDTETFKTFQAFGAATVLYIATIALIEAALLVVQHRSGRTMKRG